LLRSVVLLLLVLFCSFQKILTSGFFYSFKLWLATEFLQPIPIVHAYCKATIIAHAAVCSHQLRETFFSMRRAICLCVFRRKRLTVCIQI